MSSIGNRMATGLKIATKAWQARKPSANTMPAPNMVSNSNMSMKSNNIDPPDNSAQSGDDTQPQQQVTNKLAEYKKADLSPKAQTSIDLSDAKALAPSALTDNKVDLSAAKQIDPNAKTSSIAKAPDPPGPAPADIAAAIKELDAKNAAEQTPSSITANKPKPPDPPGPAPADIAAAIKELDAKNAAEQTPSSITANKPKAPDPPGPAPADIAAAIKELDAKNAAKAPLPPPPPLPNPGESLADAAKRLTAQNNDSMSNNLTNDPLSTSKNIDNKAEIKPKAVETGPSLITAKDLQASKVLAKIRENQAKKGYIENAEPSKEVQKKIDEYILQKQQGDQSRRNSTTSIGSTTSSGVDLASQLQGTKRFKEQQLNIAKEEVEDADKAADDAQKAADKATKEGLEDAAARATAAKTARAAADSASSALEKATTAAANNETEVFAKAIAEVKTAANKASASAIRAKGLFASAPEPDKAPQHTKPKFKPPAGGLQGAGMLGELSTVLKRMNFSGGELKLKEALDASKDTPSTEQAGDKPEKGSEDSEID